MTSTRWWRYIEPVISDMTMRDAAKQAGFNQSAFTRWKNGAKADPDFVVKFARAFHLNVLEALVEAEFITEKEAKLKQITVGGPSLTNATNEQLLDEIMRRSDPQARYLFGNEGDDDVIGLAPHLTPVSDASDSMPLSAVADDSPDEDALREEGDWTDPDYIP
ncbi:helix-turn-helix domain-containing protein [Corynebacterium striatum]|uniref:helix-turn-helix domain-containing protein n=1 Tax=Corynebacterium striatum TaxID=43770 RepID=UPI003B5CCF75